MLHACTYILDRVVACCIYYQSDRYVIVVLLWRRWVRDIIPFFSSGKVGGMWANTQLNFCLHSYSKILNLFAYIEEVFIHPLYTCLYDIIKNRHKFPRTSWGLVKGSRNKWNSDNKRGMVVFWGVTKQWFDHLINTLDALLIKF